MTRYYLYIKSHTDLPDIEMHVDAPNRKDATEHFVRELGPDWNVKNIKEHEVICEECYDYPKKMIEKNGTEVCPHE